MQSTKQKYQTTRDLFYDWIEDSGHEPPTTPYELDDLAELYLDEIAIYGRPTYWGLTLPDALIHSNSRLRGKLVKCKDAVKGLKRFKPSRHHIPVSPALAWAIAGVLELTDEGDSAGAVLLAFHCYLRIGEVVNLQCNDVVLRGDPHVPKGSMSSVTMKSTKKGPDQTVMIDDDLVEDLIRRIRGKRRGSQLLFGDTLTAPVLRAAFNGAQLLLGLPERCLMFHGLRSGGAGYDLWANRRSFEEIKKRGRWKDEDSADLYVRRTRAMLIRSTLTPTNLDLFEQLLECDQGELFRFSTEKVYSFPR